MKIHNETMEIKEEKKTFKVTTNNNKLSLNKIFIKQ